MRQSHIPLIAALLFASGASANADVAKAPVAAPAQPSPAQPQQTTASFGDWTLRCTHISATARSCEVAQGISSQDRTVAQVALGRIGRGQPLRMTILVPSNVSFAGAPALGTTHDGDAPALELAWRRCLPGGCVADGTVTDATLRAIRGWTEPARVTFADASGRAVALPFSPHGLPQALDALARDEADGS